MQVDEPATLVGLVAAMLLISSLVFGAMDVMMPHSSVITVCGIVATVGGFMLVIVATLIVIAEGQVISRLIDDEFRDVPELAEGAGGIPGSSR